ncbi:MAG: hypothetical protein AABZ28_04490, partial [Nitrospinota bacterium]
MGLKRETTGEVEKEMKKKMGNDGFKVSPRTKAVTGILTSCNARIKITPERPEDWLKINEYLNEYFIKKQKDINPFLHDLYGFISKGNESVIWKGRKQNPDRWCDLKVLKTTSGLLYGVLDAAFKTGKTKQLHILNMALSSVEDDYKDYIWNGKHLNIKEFTLYVINSVFKDIIKKYKLKIEGDIENFNKRYILAGTKNLKGTHPSYKELNRESIRLTFYYLERIMIDHEKNNKGEPIKCPFFKLLNGIVLVAHSLPIFIKINDGLDTESYTIQSLIKKAFPN